MVGALFTSIVATACLFNGASATLDPIVIKGSKFFFKSNGTQFFIKGVAYQSGVASGGGGTLSSNTNGYVDPLADSNTCKRDIKYLQQLGANTIRTYAIDPTANHDDCMQMLDAAGIYVISDLGEPNTSINRQDPAWDLTLYARYTGVVDALAKYDNTIGFFAGNEVTNNASYTPASAFVKAAVRDMKAYISSKSYGKFVGYAADDDADLRANVAAYMNCGDASTSIDFWGYNIYEWCGDSNYVDSGYVNRVAEFKDYNVPVFFAEYGCNKPNGGAGRKFTEIEALYGDDMTPVFSGGIVFEYFQEENDFGLVSAVDANSVSTLADFGAFSSQIHAVKPSAVASGSYNPTNTAALACPTVDQNWEVAAKGLPPTPNEAVCDCMMSTLTCTVASGVKDTELGELFGQVCAYNSGKPCAGIVQNTTTGVYGAYSMCQATQKLSYAFNAYYNEESNAKACDFGGKAQIVKAAGAASSCTSLIAAATSASPASPTDSGSGNGGSGGSGSGAASSTTKKGDGEIVRFSATLGIGTFCLVAYAGTALFSGAGILLL